jgi:hypothetical protein
MPIRNPEAYPKNWREVSQRIRERSGGQCECEGECGLHSKRRCTERHNEPARYAKGKVILTVAHLNHDPGDCRNENLKAMCQKCHLRYDTTHHQKNARETRRKKRALAELFCVDKS